MILSILITLEYAVNTVLNDLNAILYTDFFVAPFRKILAEPVHRTPQDFDAIWGYFRTPNNNTHSSIKRGIHWPLQLFLCLIKHHARNTNVGVEV
jgi:hypothetical protein